MRYTLQTRVAQPRDGRVDGYARLIVGPLGSAEMRRAVRWARHPVAREATAAGAFADWIVARAADSVVTATCRVNAADQQTARALLATATAALFRELGIVERADTQTVTTSVAGFDAAGGM